MGCHCCELDNQTVNFANLPNEHGTTFKMSGFIDLGPIQNHSLLLLPPGCPSCPPRVNRGQDSTFAKLKKAGEEGCQKCKLFSNAILTICPPAARCEAITWSWNYSILSGRSPFTLGSNPSEKYDLELLINPDSKHLFVTDPNLPTEFHVGRPVPSRTKQAETLSQIREWYSTCVRSHDRCRPGVSDFLPSRLLDIQSSDCPSGVRLLESRSDLRNLHVEYVCLSHCWGKSRPQCITLRGTLEQNRDCITWNTIPRTFQDAIETIRDLGFRYLWVDSICIIQDDADDWAMEGASMCDIYSCAALTLAATNSPDSHHGLYGSLNESFKSSDFSITLQDETVLPIFGRRPLPHFEGCETHNSTATEAAPLLQRGWVLQERLLSRRVVHFAANEVVWECLHCHDCQCLGGGGERFPNSKVLLGAFLHGPQTEYQGHSENPSEWFEIVEEYTRLLLTFPEDKFPALSGAARRSRQFRGGDEYVAGLWNSELLLGLSWRASHPLKARRPTWVAPTWSWAAVDSPVWWPHVHTKISRIFVASVKAACELAGPDLTGRLKSASLAISTPVVSSVLEYGNVVSERLDEMFSLRIGHNIL